MNIAMAIIGFALTLFVPGYLLTRTFFAELSEIEKVGIGIVLSICIDILIGLVLGYNAQMKQITGGITAFNLWFYLIITTLIVGIIYMMRLDKEEIVRIKKIFRSR